MKKYLLALSVLLILSGCTVTVAKSSTIQYEENRVNEKHDNNTQEKPVKKVEVKKQKKKMEADIIYKGINEKAEIKYNISKNLLTYKINPDKRILIRAGGLAGLLYINDKTYYTNYSINKIINLVVVSKSMLFLGHIQQFLINVLLQMVFSL